MRVNQGQIPPNGPHFPVADGVVLKAATFDALYAMISEWRLRHGIDPGNVQKDVDNYICGKWPHACHPEPGDGASAEMRKVPMSGRVAAWAAVRMRDMPSGGYALVDDSIAAKRAHVCLTCPFIKPWAQDCSGCNQSTRALLANIRKLRTVPMADSILGCEVCGHDNLSACFLPVESVMPSTEQYSRLWIGCWIRNSK
jgi:hypothetical protein